MTISVPNKFIYIVGIFDKYGRFSIGKCAFLKTDYYIHYFFFENPFRFFPNIFYNFICHLNLQFIQISLFFSNFFRGPSFFILAVTSLALSANIFPSDADTQENNVLSSSNPICESIFFNRANLLLA